MRERIRRDRGSSSEGLDFKTGRGGMIEAEFLVQGLQMRLAAWEPEFASAVDDLKQAGIMSTDDATALKASYEFLRRCESILRRWENKSVASLPPTEAEQRETIATARRRKTWRFRRTISRRARNHSCGLHALLFPEL